MPIISYDNNKYESHPEESVLDCLTRHELAIPSSCRSGVCQTCMLRAINGSPPSDSQKGLKPALVEQNYFLSCACIPSENLEVVLPNTANFRTTTYVNEIENIASDIVRLRLQHPDSFTYSPGQFLTLFHPSGNGRSYSIASVPDVDDYLEFHIHIYPGGLVSSWVADELSQGDKVVISEAIGECIYTLHDINQSMLMIATGTGFAPIYGILKQALRQGHQGTIILYHGSRYADGLYLVDEMNQLAEQHANLEYFPCVSGEWTNDESMNRFTQGRASDIALRQNPELKNWRAFICGSSNMVSATKRSVFMAGVSMQDIHSDAFLYSE